MSSKHCTVKDIARAAGVSLSTVSYSLRNNARIPAATRQRIQAVAESLGYRRNPHIAALMSVIGRGRKVRTVENIALIWPHGTRHAVQTEDFCRDIVKGVENRAQSLGFGVVQFFMEEDGLSGARISTILATRNIRGLIFSPALHGPSLAPSLDWSRFVTVALGHAQWTPEMHRCMSNHYHAVRLCLDRLAQSGAKRPAAIFSNEINQRTDFSQEASFLTHHPQPAHARKLIYFVHNRDFSGIFRWLETSKADSVIYGTRWMYKACLDLDRDTTAKYRPVTLDWGSRTERIPGIKFRYDLIAESAVDLLATQLHTNEVGVPDRARRLSLHGDWID